MKKPTNSSLVTHISKTKQRLFALRHKVVRAILPKRFYLDSCTLTSAQHEWMSDDDTFMKIANQAARIVNKQYPDYWKLRVAMWAKQQAHLLEGDLVECGVNRGYISTALLLSGISAERTLYLCDCWDIECYDSSWDQIQLVFSRWNLRVELCRGYMPMATELIKAEKISYLYLDMNDGQVELETFVALRPKLVKGAIILLDDYCYPGFESSMKPWRDSGINIMPLPTGQGMIVMP